MGEGNFWENKKILLTGGAGFFGHAVFAKLLEHGAEEKNIFIPRSRDFDLRRQDVARELVKGRHIVIHLAATVGGIAFNKENPARVFYDNAAMALYLIDEAFRADVQKFVGIGSIVEYPEFASSPIREEELWSGYPDAANSSYALAKRFMLSQSQFYSQQYGFSAIHLIPVKIYGPGMSFDPKNMQVIAALMQKITDAIRLKKNYIEVWGTGRARREFIYVDDAAEAIVSAVERYNGKAPVNIGSGQEIYIKDLVAALCRLLEYRGGVRWDISKPEGRLESVADITRAKEAFGFSATISLEQGLKKTINWYKQYQSS